MSKEYDDGGPAFPALGNTYGNANKGMTLWDYYAAAALTGQESNPNNDWDYNESAQIAAKMADAMIAERKKRFK